MEITDPRPTDVRLDEARHRAMAAFYHAMRQGCDFRQALVAVYYQGHADELNFLAGRPLGPLVGQLANLKASGV